MKYFGFAMVIIAMFVLSGCVIRKNKETTSTTSIVIVPDSQYKAGEKR
ncbi:MAG: hypothetical protein LBB59_03865 [Campylobacteraceae bacterium]|jgi:hypothetical protein|nr:hypothetical protein [Campylobacteraceae bacterium]